MALKRSENTRTLLAHSLHTAFTLTLCLLLRFLLLAGLVLVVTKDAAVPKLHHWVTKDAPTATKDPVCSEKRRSISIPRSRRPPKASQYRQVLSTASRQERNPGNAKIEARLKKSQKRMNATQEREKERRENGGPMCEGLPESNRLFQEK